MRALGIVAAHTHTHTLYQGGFINALAFSHSGSYLVAGVGQEHRLGRWWKDRTAKNGIAIIPLHKNV